MRLSNRLQRLEKSATANRAATAGLAGLNEEHEAKLEAAWAVMRETMREEHAQMVVDSYAARVQGTSPAEPSSHAGGLLRRCLQAMERRPHWPYTEIRPEVALAMPPHVVEVYLAHPYVLALHDCEDCGYEVPVEYFKECPLCRGRVGWYAYWEKHKDDARVA